MTAPATLPARPAATVVVLRPRRDTPFEVLMVRRNDQVAFMAGAHVFPGGRVDVADDALPADACDGLDALGRLADLPAADEARYRVAAIRELLEEAGVLLARDASGALVDAETAASVRASLSAETAFVPLLAARHLRVALDAVMPFAHWVTPDIEIRRFDTRFLLARMPERQNASHDDGETTALDWLTPHEAVARAERGEISLPPPTWITLLRLGTFASVDEAWRWAATTPIARIEPGFTRDGVATILTLPGDSTSAVGPDGEPLTEMQFELVAGVRWRRLPT